VDHATAPKSKAALLNFVYGFLCRCCYRAADIASSMHFSSDVFHRREGVASRKEAGFTVIEIIVALAILALSLSVLFGVISDGLLRTNQAAKMEQAVSLAQSLLAKVGTELPVRQGLVTGEFSDGFRWNVRMEPYGDNVDRQQWPLDAYKVSAEVVWGDRSREESITVSTLRLGPKEAAR
jgi:general secretion pathway protein I